VIPNFVWPTVQFSRSDEASAGGDSAGVVSRARQTGAGRSLKTQQRVCEAARGRSLSSCALRPSPVDIPKAAGAIKQTSGALKGSLERR
jgi:hypothetical protein